MLDLEHSPYRLELESAREAESALRQVTARVDLLRSSSLLTEQSIKQFYAKQRFEQVAESNAIEGSTLSVGETELAVLTGVTITGHDPAYTKDAIALDEALRKLTELARDRFSATDLAQLHTIHKLLLGERSGGGVLRRDPVRIRGAKHTPPKTWERIMEQMEHWEGWSLRWSAAPAPWRASVLHAWLAHIHPYIDGNGRAARAVGNPELIRAGYPPIIIRRKERARYLAALSDSDEGDLRAFLELIFDRVEGALTTFEALSQALQPDERVKEQSQINDEGEWRIWDANVRLLGHTIVHHLSQYLQAVNGSCTIRHFEEPLDLEDFWELSCGRWVPPAWAFLLNIKAAGVRSAERLACISARSAAPADVMHHQSGPAIIWCAPQRTGFPKWAPAEAQSPLALESSTRPGGDDRWHVRRADGTTTSLSLNDLSSQIARAVVQDIFM